MPRIAVAIGAGLLAVLSVLWIVFLPIEAAGTPTCADALIFGEGLDEDGKCIEGFEKDKVQFIVGSGLAGLIGLIAAGLGFLHARTGRHARFALISLSATIVAVLVTILFLDVTVLTNPELR